MDSQHISFDVISNSYPLDITIGGFDLTDNDVENITEAVISKDPKAIAKCVLNVRSLFSEIQQQMLKLMDDPDRAHHSYPSENTGIDSTNLGDGLSDNLLTAPKTPITGKLRLVKPKFKCTYCTESFKLRSAFKRHVATHEAGVQLNGDSLHDDQAKLGRLESDIKLELPPTPATCVDGIVVKRKARAPKKRSVASGKRVECEICGVQTLKQHMARHQRGHTGEKQFICDVPGCEMGFSRKDKWREHIRKHENPDGLKAPKIHKCNQCEFETKDRSEFRRHAQVHPPVVLECPECNKKFCGQTALSNHQARHTNGGESFMCETCGVSFSREPNLMRHMRQHNTPAPYSCQFCQKPYYRRNEMLIHERGHTGEKPFVCEHCGASYSAGKYLNRHLLDKHSGVKPWICEICTKPFSRAENMRAHRKIHDKKDGMPVGRQRKSKSNPVTNIPEAPSALSLASAFTAASNALLSGIPEPQITPYI